MSEKLCINCRFLRVPIFNHFECHHPNNIDTSLINGEEIYKRTPKELRYQINFNNSCGGEARWFEPKDDAPPF